MANILENVGERAIEDLDYVGSLNIQWWATVRAMGRALPFVGNRYRWQATVRQMQRIHPCYAGSVGTPPFWRAALRD